MEQILRTEEAASEIHREQSEDWMSPGVLSRISLFRGLSSEHLTALGALLRQHHFAAGAIIMSAEQVGEVVARP